MPAQVRNLPLSVVRTRPGPAAMRGASRQLFRAAPPRRLHVVSGGSNAILLLLAAQAAPNPRPSAEIVVTAARVARRQGRYRRPASPSSMTQRIERLGEPLLPALLRLTPSAAVAASGPAGLVHRSPHPRRRGQPHLAVHRRHPRQRPRGRRLRRASSCSMPTSPRGSKSCAARNRRCGAREAIGGVIAVNGADEAPRGHSHGHARRARSALPAGQRLGQRGRQARRRLSRRARLAARERDRQLRRRPATATATATSPPGFAAPWRCARRSSSARPASRSTAAVEFDGYRPRHLRAHADTLDTSRNRLAAGRVWAEFGSDAHAP